MKIRHALAVLSALAFANVANAGSKTYKIVPGDSKVTFVLTSSLNDIKGESKSIDYDRFRLSADMAPQFKPNLAILHPLPRRNELDRALDTDPRARYWDQVKNGMWMRAAIIAYIFNADAAILDHFQSHYTY